MVNSAALGSEPVVKGAIGNRTVVLRCSAGSLLQSYLSQTHLAFSPWPFSWLVDGPCCAARNCLQLITCQHCPATRDCMSCLTVIEWRAGACHHPLKPGSIRSRQTQKSLIHAKMCQALLCIPKSILQDTTCLPNRSVSRCIEALGPISPLVPGRAALQ
jgi:hypothetical protein